MADFKNSRPSKFVEDRRPVAKGYSTEQVERRKAIAQNIQDRVNRLIEVHNSPFATPTLQRKVRENLDSMTEGNHRISTRRLKIK
jgi:hypothetical protein